MRDFEYAVPGSLEDAISLLSEQPDSARPLAGGTDLIDHVRTGRLLPDLLVDIKKIPELNILEISDAGLRIGAAVPCCEIYGNEQIRRHYSAISDSCHIVGGIQIQNRASVGGNLCNSSPAADCTPSLIALNATCVVAGPAGSREIAVEEFCTGPGRNQLESGELLVEIRCPARSDHSGSHYRRFIPRNEMDIAVVGVGVSITLDPTGQEFADARIGLGAVAPTALLAADAARCLVGNPVSEESIRQAAETAKQQISPIDDLRGTREFRIHVTGVLVERSLQSAIERAMSTE